MGWPGAGSRSGAHLPSRRRRSWCTGAVACHTRIQVAPGMQAARTCHHRPSCARPPSEHALCRDHLRSPVMLCIVVRYGAAVVNVAGEAQQRGMNGEARKQIVRCGGRVGSA